MNNNIERAKEPEQKCEKEEKINNSRKADLTHKQDLSIAIMNMISIEEHLAFTAMKTKKQDYLHILSAVRKLRTSLAKELVTNTEGELWCISKHLLAATMRLMETATKHVGKDNTKAQTYENAAFDLYGLFWMLQETEGEETEKTGANTAAVTDTVTNTVTETRLNNGEHV